MMTEVTIGPGELTREGSCLIVLERKRNVLGVVFAGFRDLFNC